jgi:hypothetical protein
LTFVIDNCAFSITAIFGITANGFHVFLLQTKARVSVK